MAEVGRGPLELVVVGAGFAGLAAAYAARERGVEAPVLERADAAGGAWRHMPADMVCLSTRARDRFPDGTLPPGEGVHATAREVLEGIERFAERHRFDLRLGVEVRDTAREAGGPFVLATDDGTVETRRLLVATGEHARPRVPELPGRFDGPREHVARFDVNAVAPGERVLVVGAGNSGAETALALAARGADVVLASRHPLGAVHEAPTRGLREQLAWWASALPVNWLPGRAGCTDLTPLRVSALVEAVRDGRVRLVPAATAYHERGAELEGGERVDVDRIVLATGYRRDTAWLDPLVPTDARGTPRHVGGLSLAEPGLGFVGIPCMRTRRSGFLRGFTDDARHVVGRLLAS